MGRSRTSNSLVLFFLLLLGATAPVATAAVDELVLPSEICRGLFIVPVTFGKGEGTTLDLLLDTGSSWTILDPGALYRAGSVEVRAGKVNFQGASIGPHELGAVKASVISMRSLRLALGRDVDGILGFPAFQDVLLTLDYPSEEVRVSSGRLPQADGREIFQTSGKRPHLKAVIDGRRFKLLLDSGYTGWFQLKPSDRLTWAVEPRPASSSVTAYGFVVKDGGRLDGIARFGPLDFENPVLILGGGGRQVGWQVLRHFVLTFDQKNDRMRMVAKRTGSVRMAPLIGTGMAYDPRPEGLRIVKVFPGSSVEAAGLLKGDLIVAIDGIPVHQRGCVDRGTAGMRQVFSYVRNGKKAEVEVETEVLVP